MTFRTARTVLRAYGGMLVLMLVLLTTFVIGYLGIAPTPRVSVTWETQGGYLPASTSDGAELALVYIGSSTCSYANSEELPALLETVRELLRERAQKAGRSFATIGVSKDLDVEAGIKHLQKYGHFDEIMTGRGWLNIGLLKYVYEGFPGKAATPQVLVVDRRKVRTAGSAIQDEVLVLRKVGADEIAAWASLGTPLPPLRPAKPDDRSTRLTVTREHF